MELTKKDIAKLHTTLATRFENLSAALSGKEFTTNAETPWRGCMDADRRAANSYIDKYELNIALADFKTILDVLSKLK